MRTHNPHASLQPPSGARGRGHVKPGRLKLRVAVPGDAAELK